MTSSRSAPAFKAALTWRLNGSASTTAAGHRERRDRDELPRLGVEPGPHEDTARGDARVVADQVLERCPRSRRGRAGRAGIPSPPDPGPFLEARAFLDQWPCRRGRERSSLLIAVGRAARPRSARRRPGPCRPMPGRAASRYSPSSGSGSRSARIRVQPHRRQASRWSRHIAGARLPLAMTIPSAASCRSLGSSPGRVHSSVSANSAIRRARSGQIPIVRPRRPRAGTRAAGPRGAAAGSTVRNVEIDRSLAQHLPNQPDAAECRLEPAKGEGPDDGLDELAGRPARVQHSCAMEFQSRRRVAHDTKDTDGDEFAGLQRQPRPPDKLAIAVLDQQPVELRRKPEKRPHHPIVVVSADRLDRGDADVPSGAR